MKTGLAIWHYPHRSGPENIRYFARQGFRAVSQHGGKFVQELQDPALARAYAQALTATGLDFTVHYTLPGSHEPEAVAKFRAGIDAIAQWQRQYGLIRVLSFDVPQSIRPQVGDYAAYALERVEGTPIALEDFGLNDRELQALAPLRGNPNFGLLVDIGHLCIRIGGRRTDGRAVFTNSPLECPPAEQPGEEQLLRAFRSKAFPIFEVHHHSNDGERDLHLFLQDGVVDTPAVARVLKKLDFSGIVTIESAPGYMFPCAGQAADEGIAQSLALWQSALQ